MKNKKGSALAYALVMMSAVLIILLSMIQFVVSQIKYSYSHKDREEAFQIAESGVSFYRWYLAHETEAKTAGQIRQFWGGDPIAVGTPACGEEGAYEVEYSDPSGSALGKYCLEVTPPEDYSTIAIVKSMGWTYRHPEAKRTIQVRLRRPAWSEYMIFSNDMFRLSNEARIYGKMHSATGIHFDGVAYNTVTSENGQYYDEDYDAYRNGVWTSWPNDYNSLLHSDVFLAGKEYPVTRTKEFSALAGDFTLMKQEAVNQTNESKYFDNSGKGRRIILKNDGTFDVCTVNSYDATGVPWLGIKPSYAISSTNGYLRNSGSGTCSSCSGLCLSNHPIPDNGVIFVEDNIWLEGQVDNERVTIVAADLLYGTSPNVFVGMGNIRYTNYDGSDIIGIVAQNNVLTVRFSLDNLRIDGAILSTEGRVGREKYLLDHRNSWTVYGSIASYGRIYMGRDLWIFDIGYDNVYLYFDNNLIYQPPPYFPTDSRYLLDSWEEL